MNDPLGQLCLRLRGATSVAIVMHVGRLMFLLGTLGLVPDASAEDRSAAAILQIFEARWETVENRMADIFQTGYGRLWLPPPARGGSGFSVGYDVFDRFDLGTPRNETHYGTATGFKAVVDAAHGASVAVNTDLILNHNGVGNRNDANFVALGGYPGFALTLPGDIDGDFHNPFIDALNDDQILGQLSGLNDLAQEKNHEFIRHPVDPGNPANLPAGTLFNRPDPGNAAKYPDRDLGGNTVFDPRLGTNVTLYDFNAASPASGDPVSENALGVLLRNVRWMVQEYGVDGFRLDAARHFPRWVLDYFDQATFLAKREPLLDGSPHHVYSFSETGFDSPGFLQDFVRKDIDNNNLGQIGGNRDILDFRLFNALRDNLTGNGLANNWHAVRGASMDLHDDGLRNGSQGVAFTQSHDEQGAFLMNVAYAYALLLPGNAVVYHNAQEFGPTGNFPQPGKVDALGGFHGDTLARLVEIRNTHGRGDFHERWIDDAFNPNGFSNIYVYERNNSAIVGLSSRNDSFTESRSGVQTNFAPGAVLVELTGNASDPTVDPGGTLPDAIRVGGSGQIDLQIPANGNHGRGYVVYGLANPQGSLTITNTSGSFAGGTPTAATNGTTRLANIPIVRGETFGVQLTTHPVTLPAPAGESMPVRDFAADGDAAVLRIDGGLDLNASGGVDHVTPESVVYGFEEFTTERTPGYIDDGNGGNGGNAGTGTGTYAQTIDTSLLSEGRHYITARAFRHRSDGGPAIYTDFRETIYVDRLPPESAVVSFEPFASQPTATENRDLVVRSIDQTADNMHFFLDLAPNVSDAQIMAMVNNGVGDAGEYDRDRFVFGYFGVETGNHVATVVTFEPTGNSSIQRFPGLFTQTRVGAGFGDLNANGTIEPADLIGAANGSFEQVLFSQGDRFDAAADVDGDGLVTTLDLLELASVLTGSSEAAQTAYGQLLRRRGDLNRDGTTDEQDVAQLYANIGQSDWLSDFNADGIVALDDVATLVDLLARTTRADFNLSGDVEGQDYLAWQRGFATVADARFDQGDTDLDRTVDGDDLAAWATLFGSFVASNAAGVPEPATGLLAWIALTSPAVSRPPKIRSHRQPTAQ
jgi:glycosidase